MPATYEAIATTTLGSAQNTVSFTSIPATFTDLILIMDFAINSNAEVFVSYNNATTGFSRVYFEGNGSTTTSNTFNSSGAAFNILGRSSTMTNIIQIMNYANTNVYKATLARFSAPLDLLGALISTWQNTAAINRVDLSVQSAGTFNTGSIFTLYGIKAA